ncbi:MAG: hypothetical protein JXA99_17160, partial [Candidatus Lokiarchaeota archaeon]|nr:hypothetical protein [Candidatus Lokiarchaeota archaeon]
MKKNSKKSIYTILFIVIFLITTNSINKQNSGIYKENDSEPILYLDEEPKSSAIVHNDESYLYVIITCKAFINPNTAYKFEDLIDNKLQKGIYGTIVTVEDIYNNYGGRDNAEKIRNFIVDAYNRWETRYVLLGGDSNIIPPRYFCNGVDLPDWIPGPQDPYAFYTDLYYSAIHINWDGNLNRIYGEESDWNLILNSGNLGDVYVGRAPVGSTSEVNNFVRKTLAHEYELKHKSDVEYLYSGLMAGEFEGIDWEDPPNLFFGADCLDQLYMCDSNEYCHAHDYQTKKIPDTYHFETLYERDTSGYYPPNIIIESWTNYPLMNFIESEHGVHILNYHGLPFEVVAPGGVVNELIPLEEAALINHNKLMELDFQDVASFRNQKCFFLYSYQGNAFYFADEIDQNYYSNTNYIHFTYDSIGEELITSTYGAFAAIGDIGVGPRTGARSDLTNDPNQMIGREFYDAIFQEGINEIGRALQDAKEELLRRYTATYGSNWDKRILCTTTLFGDPMASIKPKEQSIFDDHGLYNYVIITNEALKNSHEYYTLQDFIDFKTIQGYYPKIVTLEEIRDEYEYWEDDPGKIRAFIQDAYGLWGTRYILLCGDDSIIPMREFQSPLINENYHYDYKRPFPSDQYYASLDCYWDEDFDGIYGEEKDWDQYLSIGNKIQIAVGRAPVSTTNQLSNFLRKTLLHEQELSENNDDFYLYSVLNVGQRLDEINFGGDDLDYLIYNEKTSGYCDSSHYSTKQFDPYYSIDKLYDRDDYSEHNWDKSDLISKLTGEHGIHIINNVAHGHDKLMKMTIPEIGSLRNTKNFFMYTTACEIFAFHLGNTLGEQCMNSNNGAFAMIGNIGLGLYLTYGEGPNENYLRQFYDAIFREGLNKIGWALQDAKNDALTLDDALWLKQEKFNAWKYIYLSLNLFGDPSVEITQDLTPPDLVRDDNINIGLSNIEVLDDGNVTFNYNLRSGITNIGGKSAGGFDSRFGLWGDNGMYYLGLPYHTNELNPNEYKPVIYNSPDTITVPLGEYQIFHYVDINDDVYESEEGNNYLFDPNPLILEPDNFYPDITSGDIEITKSNIILGDNEITFSYEISSDIINKGLLVTNKGFWVQYIAKNGNSVYPLGEYYIESLDPINQITTNCSGTITLPFGEYEIICSVDNDANVEEKDENNNIYNDSYPLVVSNDILLPDLTIYNDIDITTIPLSIFKDSWTGENLIDFFYDISFNVKNYGLKTTKTFSVEYYLRSMSDHRLYFLGDYYIDGLDQNEVKNIHIKEYFSLPFDTYQLHFLVDPTTLLPESNKNNNLYFCDDLIEFSPDDCAPDFEVVDFIDYKLTNLIMEEEGEISFSYNLSSYIFNSGLSLFGIKIPVDFYIFEGDNIYYLGGVNDLTLLDGDIINIYTACCYGNITIPFGKYELKCIIDKNNQVIELNESNNIHINSNPIIDLPGCIRIDGVEDKIVGDRFTTHVYINSGDQRIAAYGLNFTFDSNIVNIQQITAGPDGFISATEIDN